jgi:DNA replication protein DnaC
MTLQLDPELEAGLRRLRLRGMRELAPELLQTAKTQRWAPHELLATLVREEIASREASNERARLKAAGFPAAKTLDAFDLKASQLPRATFEFLASLEWLQRKDNLAWPARPASARATWRRPWVAPRSPPAPGSASSRPTS